MKKLLSLIFAISLTLSACGTAQTQIAPPAQTSTPTLAPTETQTPIPPTATITPLPTIPTFTPSFDVSTIVTLTPAEKAECPKENPSLNPDTKILFNKDKLPVLNETALLDFLNSGGAPSAVIDSFVHEFHWFRPDMGIQQDITGDGIDDLILNDSRFVYVLGCKTKNIKPG